MVISFIGAKFLGPSLWGKWQILNLILIYGPNAQMGVLNAMNRNVPLLRGQGKHEIVKETQSTVFSFQLIVSLLLIILVNLIALLWFPKDLLLPTFLLGVLLFVTMIHLYFQVYMKSTLNFYLFGKQQILLSILLFFLSPIVVLMPKISSIILVRTFAITAVLLLIWKELRFSPIFKLDFAIIKELIRIGWPILSVGLVYTAMTTVDRIIIARYLGSTQLGYYSIAIMVSNLILLIPLIIAQQIYPRMTESWGKTRSMNEIFKWMKRQIITSLLLSMIVIVCMALTVKPIVSYFLPKYISGIPAVYPILLLPILTSFLWAISNAMNSIGKQKLYLYIQIISLVLLIIFDAIAVKFNFGITGIAWATVIAFIMDVLLSLSGIVLISRNVKHAR